MGDVVAHVLELFMPRRPWYRNVYLRSAHWERVRERALRAAGFACEHCHRRTHLDVHHLTYKRMWHERPSDVVAICRACHVKAHLKAKHG